jgi:hypothetical protein
MPKTPASHQVRTMLKPSGISQPAVIGAFKGRGIIDGCGCGCT